MKEAVGSARWPRRAAPAYSPARSAVAWPGATSTGKAVPPGKRPPEGCEQLRGQKRKKGGGAAPPPALGMGLGARWGRGGGGLNVRVEDVLDRIRAARPAGEAEEDRLWRQDLIQV